MWLYVPFLNSRSTRFFLFGDVNLLYEVFFGTVALWVFVVGKLCIEIEVL